LNDESLTRVTIDGDLFDLTGDDPEFLKNVAEYVNEKTAEVRRMRIGTATSPSQMKQLIILNIAEDYIKQAAKTKELQNELAKMQKELEAFLDA